VPLLAIAARSFSTECAACSDTIGAGYPWGKRLSHNEMRGFRLPGLCSTVYVSPISPSQSRNMNEPIPEAVVLFEDRRVGKTKRN
jgi:hypothetical protein